MGNVSLAATQLKEMVSAMYKQVKALYDSFKRSMQASLSRLCLCRSSVKLFRQHTEDSILSESNMTSATINIIINIKSPKIVYKDEMFCLGKEAFTFRAA